MTIHEASRTLLKSPPELWAECSDATSLNRHLDQFGEIRITRLEPETAVAWEGENASGTVRLEPSGWGTRVILTAEEVDPVVEQGLPPVAAVEGSEPAVAEADPEPEPAALEPEPAPEPQAVEPEPEPVEPEPPFVAAEPEPSALRGGFLARLMARMRAPAPVLQEPTPRAVTEPEPVFGPTVPEPTAEAPKPEPAVEPPEVAEASEPVRELEPSAPTATTPLEALTGALESLGMAHHRPYSRS